MALFGMNIYLMIGVAIVMGAAALLLLTGWTLARVLLWQRAQKRESAEVARGTRRADGKLYPPKAVGVCDRCRQSHHVYCPPGAGMLCAACYEAYWPTAEPTGPALPT